MILVITIVQQFNTRLSPERRYDLIYLLQIPSFTEVRDTFHNLIPSTHTFLFNDVCTIS